MAQRILLVDDQPQNLRLLEAILGPYGYSISAASSRDEAMRSIATDAPDLVLLDVVMPGMTGYDVCRQIRAHDATKFVPIVMMTASPDHARGHEGTGLGLALAKRIVELHNGRIWI